MHVQTIFLHLKECEFRFNHRRPDLNHAVHTLCQKNPLGYS